MTGRLGALLRGLRLEAGLTQEQLAERSRLGVRTIHRLETGTPTDARMGTVKRAAHALADALRRDREQVWAELMAARQGPGPVAGADPAGADPARADPAVPGPVAAPGVPVPAARAPVPVPLPVPPPARPGSPDGDALAGVAGVLAHDVYGRCVREEEQRRVHDPFPLPVRFRSAPERLLDHWDNIHGGPDGSPDEALDGGLADIAAVYRRVRSGRLVVLGRAGSGKTVLVLRFVLDYVGTRAEGEPVPVVFSIGSWDPTGTTLRDWLIERLLRDHPNLAAPAPGGGALAAALVDARWILPVLDGFDEIAPGLLGLALRELNASALPLLMTSRTEQFAEAVEIEVFRRTAGISLMDLTTDDLAHYLPRTARPTAPAGRDAQAVRTRAATGWDPVLDRLRTDPGDGPGARLAAVLSTPLMILLARTVYSDTPAQDPAVLLDTRRFPTAEAIEEHLLAGFVPTVYRHRPPTAALPGARRGRRPRTWDPHRARHYLGHLAAHLDDRHERHGRNGRHALQDLAWWQLRDSLRLSSRIVAVVLACSLVTAVADWLVFPAVNLAAGRGAVFALGAGLLDALLFGPAVGLSFGLVYALVSASGIRAFEPSRMRMRLPRGRAGRGRAGRGRRAAGPSARRFAALFSAGLLGGFVMGLGCGLASTAGPWLTTAHRAPDAALIGVTAVNSLVYGLVFGLAGGLVLGLVAALETPIDLGSAATPTDLLAINRSVVVRQALFLAPMLTLVIAVGGRLITELFQGFLGPLAWPMADGLALGAVGGLAGALSYALAFTAWGQWVLLTRIWLPLTGRLPWATVAFLDDAYRRGVLRQVGAVYQFRHARLQRQLRGRPVG
ncbi:helix-turn-helix domain-containing protein [Streptomyces sp. NBC_00536]|uniref:helix-turn-helix domain-containing protein n=1 Tax=Streptomyces sp. NBC_00536 TaxID=2975769 RepID=UPI002E80E608|nr:helix-turn-helix domain-containing protein [Streptomyces sp. NBC_00536]WUC81972.1 helix-turn-helix domain-containing protein [Streptomyces sp. NBC_00536]